MRVFAQGVLKLVLRHAAIWTAHLTEAKLTKQIHFRTQNVSSKGPALMVQQLVPGSLN
jgi:hypothetical protein